MFPIADMLTRIRNSQMVQKETVRLPYSQIKSELAEILKKEGYINDVAQRGTGVKKELVLTLMYEDGSPKIVGLSLVSRPSQRIYVSKKEVARSVRGGITILSTSRGVLTGKEARKQGVGGELVCEIW